MCESQKIVINFPELEDSFSWKYFTANDLMSPTVASHIEDAEKLKTQFNKAFSGAENINRNLSCNLQEFSVRYEIRNHVLGYFTGAMIYEDSLA